MNTNKVISLIDIDSGEFDKELKMMQNSSNYYFRVIGVDRKIHVSDLHGNKCECGVEILKKYVTEKDYSELFSCYECTF